MHIDKTVKSGEEGMRRNDEMANMGYVQETGLIGIDVPYWNEVGNKIDSFISSC